MEYNLINPTYKYDQLASAIQLRQLEHFHYDVDKKNFEQMLTQELDAAYRSNIETRLAETLSRMSEVEAIYAALQSQIDNQEAYEAAVARLV